MSGFLTTKGGTRYYVRVDGDIWDEDGRKFSRTDKEALDRALQAGAENPDAEITYTTEQEVEVNIAALRQAYANPLNDTDASDEGAPPPLPAVNVTTSSLPNGTVGVAYSQTLQATGGDGGYAWSRLSGSLPGGLSLNPNGQITGTPTSTVTAATFTVQADDETGNPNSTDSRALAITVDATAPGPTPFYTFDPSDYADTAAFKAYISGQGGEFRETTGSVDLVSVSGQAFSKAVQTTWNVAGPEQEVSWQIPIPGGHTEVWVRQWVRHSTSPQFTYTDGPGSSGGPGGKHDFFFSTPQDGASRFNFSIGLDGDQSKCLYAGEDGAGDNGVSMSQSSIFDGNWGVWYYHLKKDASTGLFNVNLKGTWVRTGSGLDTTGGSGSTIDLHTVGGNINRGIPAIADGMKRWTGIVEYYTSPPNDLPAGE
jgi:hypothetical protein